MWAALGCVGALATAVAAGWHLHLVGQLPPKPDLSKAPLAMRRQVESAYRRAWFGAGDGRRVGDLALTLHANQFYEPALLAYRRAGELDDDWRWRYGPGILHGQLGDVAAAAAAMRNASAAGAPDSWVSFHLGEPLARTGALDEAAEAYRQAMRADGGAFTPQPPRTAANHRFAIGDYAALGLATTEAQRGRVQAATALLTDLLNRSPDWAPALRLLSDLRRESGDVEAARTLADRAASLTPYVPPADPLVDLLLRRSTHSRWILKHADLAQRGDEAEWAQWLARRAVAADPDDHYAVLKLGHMLFDLGRFDEALPWLRRHDAMVARRDNLLTLHKLSGALLGAGRDVEAEGFLRTMLQQFPADADFHHNLGSLLHRQDRRPEAQEHYRRALELRPAFAMAHVNLARLLAETRHGEQAVSEFEKALALEDNPAWRVWLAQVHHEAGKLEAAAEELRIALAADPDNPVVLGSLVRCLLESNRFEEAEPLVQRLAGLYPRDAELRVRHARILWRLGRAEEATAEARHALQIDPGHRAAGELLEEVEAMRRRE
jgi:tetratricopeptide (TPR) repeat protein